MFRRFKKAWASLLASFFIVTSVFLPNSAYAQYRLMNKNKVQYRKLEWYVAKLPRTNLYFYPQEEKLASHIAAYAENAHEDLEKRLDYKLKRKVPLIFYSTRPAFLQTNLISFIPEGVGGFRRIEKIGRTGVPHDGSLKETSSALKHELMHSYTADMIKQESSPIYDAFSQSKVPLWFNEGLSEYFSKGRGDSIEDMVLRDLTLHNKIVPPYRAYMYGYEGYRIAHSFVNFLASRYGEKALSDLLKTIGNKKPKKLAGVIEAPADYKKAFEGAFRGVFGKSIEKLSEEWHTELKQKYYGVYSRNPDPDIKFASKLIENTSGEAVYGDKIYYVRNSRGINELVELDLLEGEEKIIAKDMHGGMEAIHGGVAASQHKLVFIASDKESDRLFIYAKKDGTVESFKFKGVANISGPSISDSERLIAFNALDEGGMSDIYVFDTFKKSLERITSDFYSEGRPVFAKDKSNTKDSLIFTSDRKGDYDLYELNLNDNKVKQLTSSKADEISPRWHNGKIYFVSDEGGTYNLHLLEKGKQKQLTDVVNGVFSPNISSDIGGDKVYFTYYDNGETALYLANLDKLEKNAKIVEVKKMQKEDMKFAEMPLKAKKYKFESGSHYAYAYIDPARKDSWGRKGMDAFLLGGYTDLFDDYNFFTFVNKDYRQKNADMLFEFANQKNRLNYSIKASKLAYSINTKQGDYGIKESGVKLSLLYPVNRFVSLSPYISYNKFTRGEPKYPYYDMGAYFSDYGLFEGISPPRGEKDSLVTAGCAFRKDNTVWEITGPISGDSLEAIVEASLNKKGKLSPLFMATYSKHFPVGKRSCFAFKVGAGISEGENAKSFRLSGFSMPGYDLFTPEEGTKMVQFNTSYRFPLFSFVGAQSSFGLGMFFTNIGGELHFNAASLWDKDGKQSARGSLGAGIAVPTPFGPIKVGYVKKTDFKDFFKDLGEKGKWYVSFGYHF